MAFSENDLSEFRVFAEKLADIARVETLKRFRSGTEVHNKAGIWYDPVTDADREAERALRRAIKAVYPSHGILGEEFGSENDDAPFRWVLDPVDGTRAFVCGVPSWVTLIAFEHEGRSLVSVLDQPFTDERWIGEPERCLYKKSDAPAPCKTSGESDLANARITTTDPRASGYFTSGEAAMFEEIAEKARLARFSLDAYGYGLLASGEIDLVIEAGLAHHDYAALAPVVEGAGGVITNWRGGPFNASRRGRVLAAASPALHKTVLDLLRENEGAWSAG
ncbi:MAG: inositol monophosphatase family protein [Pseudomonadota bacterium]